MQDNCNADRRRHGGASALLSPAAVFDMFAGKGFPAGENYSERRKNMENNEKKPYAEPEVAVVELDFSEVMTTSAPCVTERAYGGGDGCFEE